MSTVSDESSEQMSSSQTRPVHMNEDEVAACRQVFNIVDEDGSGSIGAQELHRLLKLLRLPATEEEVLRMIAEVDEDGNGEVEFAEFVQMMASTRTKNYNHRALQRAFRLLAEDGAQRHQISLASVEKALVTYCGVSEREAARLAKQLLPPGARGSSINYHAVISQFLSV